MITDRYIRMCMASDEIQELWNPKVGDYFYNADRPAVGLVNNIAEDGLVSATYLRITYDKYESKNVLGIVGNIHRLKGTKFWLPTQSQLQSVITDKGYFRFSLIELFYRFANANADKFDSMDEIWLAFVMKMLYNKVWDDEKDQWIKEV